MSRVPLVPTITRAAGARWRRRQSVRTTANERLGKTETQPTMAPMFPKRGVSPDANHDGSDARAGPGRGWDCVKSPWARG